MEPSDRLKAVCKIEKITQKELAESIGMSLRGFATVLGGKSKVSKPIALAVGVKWNYRPEWILSGLGDPRPKGHIGREIVNEENIGHAAWGIVSQLDQIRVQLARIVERMDQKEMIE